jgi:uncharacterized Ntn-hydrolase superfamily protein
MTDTWLDESADYFGGDESADWYDDGDGEDVDFGDDDLFGEATKSAAARRREEDKRRAAARRRALEIQRRARASRSRTPARPVTATTAIKNTRAAVRQVDLENKVRADAVGGAVTGLRRRSTGLERTTSAAAVVNTLKNELDNFEDDLGEDLTNALKTVADFVPLVFLRSPEKGLRSPAVMAGIAGLGISVTGLIIRRVQGSDNGIGGGVDLAAPRGNQQPKPS